LKRLLLLSILLLSLHSSIIIVGASAEVDDVALVYNIVDGDTFDAFPVGRIRLADIDAPESWESGYSEAKDFLHQMIAS
jgi:endonuclease YncB( thermonuclease family)